MELTSRNVAALTTLATAVMLFTAPFAMSADDPDKIQDRVATERFSAPALTPDVALDAGQLAAHADRAGKADRLVTLATMDSSCRGAGWPAVPLRCLFQGESATVAAFAGDRPARTITVETRVGQNTSVLTRMPADIAQR